MVSHLIADFEGVVETLRNFELDGTDESEVHRPFRERREAACLDRRPSRSPGRLRRERSLLRCRGSRRVVLADANVRRVREIGTLESFGPGEPESGHDLVTAPTCRQT